MKAFFSLRSLRARIFIIILVIGVVPGVLMKYGILNNYEQRAVEHRIATVQNQLNNRRKPSAQQPLFQRYKDK